METALLEVATSQGIWVLLFVSLFLYTIKRYEKMEEKQDIREKEYQKLIDTLTQNLSILSDVKQDVEEIKMKLKS